MIKPFRNIRSGQVALVIVAVLCMIVLITAIITKYSGGSNVNTTHPQTTESSSPVKSAGDDDSTTLISDKKTLNDRVKSFSELYFARSAKLSSEEVKRSLEPYVTKTFLEDAVFGFGSSEADVAMKREGARLKVEVESDLFGEFLDEKTVEGIVMLRFTKYAKDDSVVLTFQRSQEMTWVKEDNRWLVYSTSFT